MSAPRRLVIRPLGSGDAEPLAKLLRASPPDYVRFFRPFAYAGDALSTLVGRAVRDQWFVLEIERGGGFQPAGFYMLRGLDEGFAEPMYGVFVAPEFAGLGFGQFTLAHAEAQCRLNGWPALLLKVDPENSRALRLYTAAGFRFARLHPETGEHVLTRPVKTVLPATP